MESEHREHTRSLRISVLLFVLNLASMYVTYGWVDAETNPFTDIDAAMDAASYTCALSAILLSHEMAHYFVARRHGFTLSLPYFIPFPVGFGTLGAVIRLRSLPRSRTALLEMGAAGPIAGAIVAFVLLAIGLVWTREVLEPVPGEMYAIFNDPLALKVLATWVQGAPIDRFAVLHPVAMAGWIGCLLTGLNLLPVGQTDGGHVMNALFPRQAKTISRVLIAIMLASSILWLGWAVWALALYLLGAWRGLEVPLRPPLSSRARGIALATVPIFLLSFIPRPVEWVYVDARGRQETHLLPWVSSEDETESPGAVP